MKFLLMLFLILASFKMKAASQMATVVDYLRGTPASVGGVFSVDQNFEAYKGKKSLIDVGMRLNANQGIAFSFSENHLSLASANGMSLTIQGIPVQVEGISYFENTGKFKVTTKTPLGIGENILNEELEKKLDQLYRPKVVSAFQELKSLRSKKSLQDVRQVIGAISKIFINDKGPALPDLRGKINLQFNPDADGDFKVDQWHAHIKKDDYIALGIDFHRTNNRIKIKGAEFRSRNGIKISGDTKFQEIASLNFRALKAHDTGVELDYDIGPEQTLAGFTMILNVIKAMTGHPGDLLKECDPVKLGNIREFLDEEMKKEISSMIRSNRKSLLEAGVSSSLLAALE